MLRPLVLRKAASASYRIHHPYFHHYQKLIAHLPRSCQWGAGMV